MKNSARFLAVLLVLSTFVITPILLTIAAPVAVAQVTPLDDEPDDAPGLGSIIGSPDAGPDPEDAGDRGGYAQLGLAVTMLGGVLFISWRIVRESRTKRSPGNMSTNESL